MCNKKSVQVPKYPSTQVLKYPVNNKIIFYNTLYYGNANNIFISRQILFLVFDKMKFSEFSTM